MNQTTTTIPISRRVFQKAPAAPTAAAPPAAEAAEADAGASPQQLIGHLRGDDPTEEAEESQLLGQRNGTDDDPKVVFDEALPWVNQDGLKVDAKEEAAEEEREKDTSQEDLANPAEPSAEEPVVPSGAAAGAAPEEDCHDAGEGEWCYRAVKWAMTKGIVKNPEVYPNLTAASSFAEFQANLHSRSRGSCKMPCAPAVPAAAPAAKEARSADDEPPPAEPGCYLRTPSGCPNHPAKETTWRHDVVAEGRADLDDVGCTERKERWDDYCGTSDVRMVYVPAVALVVDGTKA